MENKLIFDRTNHRLMWHWIARKLQGRNPEYGKKKLWPGWAKLPVNPYKCFCCVTAEGNCGRCPLLWEDDKGNQCTSCSHSLTGLALFEVYREGIFQIENPSTTKARRRELGKEIAIVAERIAELPLSPHFLALWRKGEAQIK